MPDNYEGPERRMTPTDGERLVCVETKVDALSGEVIAIKTCLTDITAKLDTALQDKADWMTVTALGDKLGDKADAKTTADATAALRERLDNHLPLWATWVFMASGGVISALLTAIFFLATHYKP